MVIHSEVVLDSLEGDLDREVDLIRWVPEVMDHHVREGLRALQLIFQLHVRLLQVEVDLEIGVFTDPFQVSGASVWVDLQLAETFLSWMNMS